MRVGRVDITWMRLEDGTMCYRAHAIIVPPLVVCRFQWRLLILLLACRLNNVMEGIKEDKAELSV